MSILQFPAAPRSSRSRPSDLRAVYLLDRDRDLGRLLTPSRATLARRTLRAPVLSVDRGPWTPDAATAETALLILDGLLVRDVVIADDVAAEILGPGDFIPASTDGDGTLPCGVRWTAMTPTQIACLDGGFAKAMLAFPEIALALIERQKVRADRLVTLRAIAHLNGVDRRLLALLWLLADRWGRMTRDGVILPMALRHSIMANLVGARRPTVSTAMSRLQRRDAIRQRPAGGWILREHPEGICSEVLTQAPQPRGPVFFPEKPASPAAADGDVDRRMRKLEDRANTARADSARSIRQLQSTCAAVESSRRQRPRRHGVGVPADDAAHSPGTPHDGAGSLHLIQLAAGCPLHSPYVAAKHAVRGFLGSLRVELRNRRSRVEVCMVHPGFIGTPFFDHATSARSTRPHPLRPVYRPEDVAAAVLACVRHPRAEVNVGGSATVFDLVTRLARPLSDLLLASYGVAGQRHPEPAARPGILWEPSGRGETTGSVRGRRSVWTAVRLAAAAPLDAADSVPRLRRVVRLVR